MNHTDAGCTQRPRPSAGIEESSLRCTVGWRFTEHAREQCRNRGIEKREVLGCIAFAEASVPARGGRTRFFRGDLEVIASEQSQTVITTFRHNYLAPVA